MILAVGVDVVGVGRFATTLARTPSLRARLFTPAEAGLDPAALAGCFAAKEALVKALGAPPGLAWHDAEVLDAGVLDAGVLDAATLVLRGTVLAAADALGVTRTQLRVTRHHDAVTAFVTLGSCA